MIQKMILAALVLSTSFAIAQDDPAPFDILQIASCAVDSFTPLTYPDNDRCQIKLATVQSLKAPRLEVYLRQDPDLNFPRVGKRRFVSLLADFLGQDVRKQQSESDQSYDQCGPLTFETLNMFDLMDADLEKFEADTFAGNEVDLGFANDFHHETLQLKKASADVPIFFNTIDQYDNKTWSSANLKITSDGRGTLMITNDTRYGDLAVKLSDCKVDNFNGIWK